MCRKVFSQIRNVLGLENQLILMTHTLHAGHVHVRMHSSELHVTFDCHKGHTC